MSRHKFIAEVVVGGATLAGGSTGDEADFLSFLTLLVRNRFRPLTPIFLELGGLQETTA